MPTSQSDPSQHSLAPLLHPSTVAIIGASDDPARIGGRPIRYMQDAGFKGTIYPVNPNRDSAQGLPTISCISEAPEPIDTAIIAVPAQAVVETVKACCEAKVKSAVIFSAGFAEIGGVGKHNQASLTTLARTSGMRIIGPNCLGVYNSDIGFFGTFTTTLESTLPTSGNVGLVSQSGAYGSHLSLLATQRGIGIRFWITTGNECDIDVAETIGWLARHPDISVIIAYAEGIKDRNRLLDALTVAHSEGKPVIFQKVGRTSIGAEAIRSHTASLAGSNAIYDSVFRQFGVHRARDTEEMLDIAYAATFGMLPTSRRVGLLSISGGVGVQMADEAVELGLEVTPMSTAAQNRLKVLLPYASPRNPVDITAQAFNDLELIRENLRTMLEEGTYAAIVAFFTFVAAAKVLVEPISNALAEAKKEYPQCLLILSIIGPTEIVRRYERIGCPVFADPTRAVRAVEALARFSEAFARPVEMPIVPISSTRLPTSPISEHIAKQIFSDHGFPVVEEHLCKTADEAVTVANQLGYPVALKLSSKDVAHKTEVGGVKLGLSSALAVSQAFVSVTSRIGTTLPSASVEGVIISPMVTDGIETIFGLHNDPTFGPVVMFGLGGIFVETLKDVAFRVAPFNIDEAHRMIREVRAFPLLEGMRGQPRRDLEAIASTLVSLSRFAAAYSGQLSSAELNPVLVMQEGQGLVILDALITT